MRQPHRFLLIVCILCLGCRDWLWIGGSERNSGRIVSHTKMTIFPPWNAKFEENWKLPEGAVSGSLLRTDAGSYLAVLEWDSDLACKRWIALEELLRENTVIFRSVSSENPATDKRQFSAGRPVGTRSSTRLSDEPPDVDPAILFAISAGEDVDIDLEDEVIISGGDPSFLDDEKWPSNPMDEEDESESDLEDDIALSGGDPSFLDDQSWGKDLGDEESDSDLEDDITVSGGDPSFLEEWNTGDKNQKK